MSLDLKSIPSVSTQLHPCARTTHTSKRESRRRAKDFTHPQGIPEVEEQLRQNQVFRVCFADGTDMTAQNMSTPVLPDCQGPKRNLAVDSAISRASTRSLPMRMCNIAQIRRAQMLSWVCPLTILVHEEPHVGSR